MNLRDDFEEIVITGIVSPSGWDETGGVESVCIAADDGKYYFARFKDKNEALIGFLRKNVRVRGTMSRKDGLRNICVSKIEMIRREAD